MMNLWRWTFARHYLRNRRKAGPADSPRWTAACGVTAVMFANLVTLAMAVTWNFNVRLTDPRLSPYHLAGLALLLYVNYLRFMRGGDADALIRKLERQSSREVRRAERWLWLFTLASLFAPLALAGIRFHLVGPR